MGLRAVQGLTPLEATAPQRPPCRQHGLMLPDGLPLHTAGVEQLLQSSFVPSRATRSTASLSFAVKKYDNPGSGFDLAVGVRQPTTKELAEGGPIVPRDPALQKARNNNIAAGINLVEQRKSIAERRRRKFREGEDIPEEERPETIGMRAHRLMQSGDYHDGPPYPLEEPGAPPWRRQGAELAMEVRTVEKQKFGSAKSAEVIRCFQDNEERVCPGGTSSCTSEAALMPVAVVSESYTILLAILGISDSSRRGSGREWRLRCLGLFL